MRVEPEAACLAAGPTNGQLSPLSPDHRFVIALHSPRGVFETGPPRCLPERMAAKLGRERQPSHFLWSGFRAKGAKLRPFLAAFGKIQADFSALQTVWRRGRDSNPRYRC